MGQSKQRRDAIFEKQDTCIFCGGIAVATTIEHCPPKAMFQNKEWPEGFEFPACPECNNGSSDQDLIVAMLARCGLDDKGDNDGRLSGLFKMVNKQHPEMIRKMLPSPLEARKMNRDLGITRSAGETHQDASAVKVTDEMHAAVGIFASKLAKAVFHTETARVFPAEGKLALNWFTNSELVRDGYYKLLKIFEHVPGVLPAIERNRRLLNDQFSYKYTEVSDADMFLLQATFSQSFGLVVVGSVKPERLEAMFAGFRERHGREGPFTVL
jgi:hypothetical protein